MTSWELISKGLGGVLSTVTQEVVVNPLDENLTKITTLEAAVRSNPRLSYAKELLFGVKQVAHKSMMDESEVAAENNILTG